MARPFVLFLFKTMKMISLNSTKRKCKKRVACFGTRLEILGKKDVIHFLVGCFAASFVNIYFETYKTEDLKLMSFSNSFDVNQSKFFFFLDFCIKIQVGFLADF